MFKRDGRSHVANVYLSLLCCFLFCACASRPPSFKPDDLSIASDKIPEKSPEALSADQVSFDIAYLKYALDRGYAGRNYLPSGEFDKMIERLGGIRGPMTPVTLRDHIDEILTDVPDGHLLARIGPIRSEYRAKHQHVAQVGTNFYSGTPAHPWHVEVKKLGRKKVLLISITTFPFHESSVWSGFLDSVQKDLPTVSAAIIDLRGNDGGDDSTGFEMAYLFNGGEFRQAVEATIERNTSENKALVSNIFSYTLARMKELGKPTEPYLYDRLAEAQKLYMVAKDQKLEGNTEKPEGKFISEKFGKAKLKPFGKPIFILMDRKCASSCESTIDAFEFIKGVKRVGENTEGLIHFGNVSPLILPNSKVVVQMGTHYEQYFDRRFIEKIGIKPDTPVAPGGDALEVAKDELKNL